MSSMQGKMARGAAWMFGARWLDKALGLVSTLVLARLLVPEDFGLVAIATAFSAFLAMLTNFSFDVALVQHKNPQRDHFDTVWTIGVLFGGGLALLLVVLAWPVAHFYGDPRLVGVMLMLALSVFVNNLRNIGCINFQRDLQFHKEFLLNMTKRLVTLPLTIVLAFALRSYWALVLGTLFTATVGTLLTYAMHPFRPRWSLRQKGELFAFSKWLFINNVLLFIAQRAGDFVIGKLQGPHNLGVFSLANELGSMPSTELVAPINRAAFPGYSRLASNRPELVRTYLGVIGIVALVALPAGVGLSVTAPLLVPLLLGDKWLEVIPLLQFLAVAGSLLALWTNTHYVLLALGMAKRVTILVGIQAAATLVCLLIFLLLDVPNGVGWAMLTAALVVALPNMYVWRTELDIAWRRAFFGLWRPALGSLAMAAAVIALRVAFGPLHGTLPLAGALAVCVVTGAAVYVGTVMAAWWLSARPDGAERYMLNASRKVLVKFGLRAPAA